MHKSNFTANKVCITNIQHILINYMVFKCVVKNIQKKLLLNKTTTADGEKNMPLYHTLIILLEEDLRVLFFMGRLQTLPQCFSTIAPLQPPLKFISVYPMLSKPSLKKVYLNRTTLIEELLNAKQARQLWQTPTSEILVRSK